MDNPEKLATWGTQDTGQRNKTKNTIQRNWQHGVHKTHGEEKQNKQHNTENEKDEQHGPTKVAG
jgi:hypothetical protein